MDLLLSGLVILQVVSLGFGLPGGAPSGACESMMPRHPNVQPQTTPAPYTITTNTTTLEAGRAITVTIIGPDYRGVLLEARAGDSTTPLGSWHAPPPNTRLLQCPGNAQGAMTHNNTDIKGNATMYTWKLPNSINSVFFQATVAQQQTRYWLNIRSEKLTRGGSPGIADKIGFVLLLTPCLLVSQVLPW